MAMAAVRCAGRKLVGGRGPEALSRFWPRSSASAGFGPSRLVQSFASPQSEKARLMMEVREKKEKLYRLIDEYSIVNDGKIGLSNFDLLPHLWPQVNPRPSDPVWRLLRIEYKMYIYWMIFSPPVTVYAVWVFFRERAKKKRIRREQEFLVV